MITKRLPAVRMFSVEFNSTEHTVEEQMDSYKVTKAVSPLGEDFGRVFVVGVLLDVVEVKDEPKIFRAVISDPLGTYTVFISPYTEQPMRAIYDLMENMPCYVAVVGRPKKLNSMVIRPETITKVDKATYEMWIKETIAATKKRIERFQKQEDESVKLAKETYNTKVEEYIEAIETAKFALEDEAAVEETEDAAAEPEDVHFEEEEIDIAELLAD